MQVTLSIASGSASGRSISVKTGQVVKVGRSEAVDLAIPDDAGLADVHFSLTCDSSNCYLRVADGAGDAKVNDAAVVTSVLRDGDRVTAGSTLFLVKFGGAAAASAVAHTTEEPAHPAAAAAPAPPAAASVAPAPAPAPSPAPASADVAPAAASSLDVPREASAEECRREMTLDGKPAGLAREGESGRDLLEALIGNDHPMEALRVLGYLLPKRAAVRWALECVEAVQAGAPAAAVEAARAWVAEPDETHRRAAQAAAEAANFEGAACWVALGAFWSCGSIAPVGQADVPPVESLTAQAVSAALTMAATAEPAEAVERYKRFLETGVRMLDEA